MSNGSNEHGEVRTAKDPTEAVLSKSALNEKYLCDYVLNVATGCRHSCQFCYVPGTPNIRTRGDMLADEVDVEDGQEEWGDYVLYRDDIPDRLPGILERKRTWRETRGGQGIVGTSFHTDCFMDERAAEITASAIEALAEDGRYVRILTRNPMLAASYMDVFDRASEYVTVGSSIPTLDEAHANAVEPGAPPIEARLRGLQRFNEAGIETFVSMSPTYPTIATEAEMAQLLEAVAETDPSVIFHEPINPRGKNYAQTVAAAEKAGCMDLAAALADVQGPKGWLRYACRHFAWVQEVGRERGLPIHLWPDRELVGLADEPERSWLRHWRDRQSPEVFAGRPSPVVTHREPALFSWDRDADLEVIA